MFPNVLQVTKLIAMFCILFLARESHHSFPVVISSASSLLSPRSFYLLDWAMTLNGGGSCKQTSYHGCDGPKCCREDFWF